MGKRTEQEILDSIDNNLEDIERAYQTVKEDGEKTLRYAEQIDARVDKLGLSVHAVGGVHDTGQVRAVGKWFLGKLTHDEGRVDEALGMLGTSKAALGETVGPEGGYLVPAPVAALILMFAATLAGVRSFSRVLKMNSATLDVPDIGTKPTVGVIAEGATITQSEPVLGQKRLTAKKIAAIAKMSLELEQDSEVEVGGMLLRLFAERITAEEDRNALEGSGAGGDFVGLFTAAGVNAVSAGGALTNFDLLIEALYALPAPAISRARWFMAPKALREIQQLKDTQNQYLFNPSPSAAVPMTLLGKPIHLTDSISTIRGGGSDTTIYVGDFEEAMLFGDRQQMELAANPFTDFNTGQIAVRVLERVAITVGIPSHFAKITGITV